MDIYSVDINIFVQLEINIEVLPVLFFATPLH